MSGKNGKMYLADASLIMVAFFWGGGFVVIKDALDDITPLYMMAIRFVLAFALMALVFFRYLRQISRQDLRAGLLIGVLLFSAFAIQTIALQYTTAGKQAFLTAVYVVMTPFLYWAVAKKAPDKYSLAGAFLAFFGIGFLTLQGGLSIGIGDSLTLVAAFFFAAHIVAVGQFAPSGNVILLAIIQTGVAAAVFAVMALLFEPWPTAITSRAAFSIGYQVIFSTMAAILIQNIAQKYTTSTHAAIAMSFEAVFGVLLALVFLGEALTFRIIIGCILIFIAIITTETKLSFLQPTASEKRAA